MKIVQKPSVKSVWLRNSVSSEAPGTISGTAIGRKMRSSAARGREAVPDERERDQRTECVAVMLARIAMKIDVIRASRMPGGSSQWISSGT